MSILINGMDMPTPEQGVRTINVYADGVVTNYAEVTIAQAVPVPPKEDAEEQGLLVRLPPKLYEAVDVPIVNGVDEWDVIGIVYYEGEITAYTVRNSCSVSIIYGHEVGKTVFLSREEAEAALKGESKDV